MNWNWLKKQPKAKVIAAGELHSLLCCLFPNGTEGLAAVAASIEENGGSISTPSYAILPGPTFSATNIEGGKVIEVPNGIVQGSTESDPANRLMQTGTLRVFVGGLRENRYTRTILPSGNLEVTLDNAVWTGGTGNPVTVTIDYFVAVPHDTLISI